MTEKVVSFIIVNYFLADKVAEAVGSVYSHCSVPFEVVVVDNSASADEFARLSTLLGSRARLIDAGHNGGFGAGCNAGVQEATGEYLFFLNPDARLVEDCIPLMICDMEADLTLGALGCQIVNKKGEEDHSAGDFIRLRRPLKWGKNTLVTAWYRLVSGKRDEPVRRPLPRGLRRVDYVTGADLMIRAEDFRRVGEFDEAFFMYAEETDLQYRLWKDWGLHAAIDRRVRIFHESGASLKSANYKRCLLEAGALRFVRKHRSAAYWAAYKSLTVLAALTETCLGALASFYSLRENVALIITIVRR